MFSNSTLLQTAFEPWGVCRYNPFERLTLSLGFVPSSLLGGA